MASCGRCTHPPTPHTIVSTREIATFKCFSQHLTLKYQFFSCINGELRLLSLLISVLGLLLMGTVSLYSIREIRSSRALITESLPSLDDFVFEKDGQWVMDARLGKLIDAFGSRIATSLKRSFMQGLGAQSKIDKGIKGAMAQDVIENKMPLLNLVGNVLGINTKQYIGKHPEALVQLMPLIQKFLPGQASQNNPSGGM